MDTKRFWQNKLFQTGADPQQLSQVDPKHRKADMYRSLINTVYASEILNQDSLSEDVKKSTISPGAASFLGTKLLDCYGACIDDIEGINNFADEAIALSKCSTTLRNDSKNWQTSLPVSGCDKDFDDYMKAMCSNLLARDTPDIDQDGCRKLWQEISKVKAAQGTESSAVEMSLDFLTSENTVKGKEMLFIGNSSDESLHENQRFHGVKGVRTNEGTSSKSNLVNRTIPSFFAPASRETFPDTRTKNSSPVLLSNVTHPSRATEFQDNPINSAVSKQTNSNIRNNFSWFTATTEAPPKISRYSNQNRNATEIRYHTPSVDDYDDTPPPPNISFCTAREQYIADQQKRRCGNNYNSNPNAAVLYESRTTKKSLGTRRGPNSKFMPPIANKNPETSGQSATMLAKKSSEGVEDDKLKSVDPKMMELMMNEILDHGPTVHWDDIAGLEFAKNTIMEIVVWPMLRPDIFSGLRGPPKGLLLFGPPGTGKTLIGKCIASQAKATFFCISASSLTSKWVGEGEKLVKALFTVARCYQPAVIFIDEIDSLLSQRSDSEHESSRRIKTEFLVQLDGASTQSEERILIVGATNRPHELDEAARRRLVKRLYIPLPTKPARKMIVTKLLTSHHHSITEEELENIGDKTDGYSGADMANLCKEAALGPIRDLNFLEIEKVSLEQVRPIALKDFLNALKQVRASVSNKDLSLYEEWNNRYGSGSL